MKYLIIFASICLLSVSVRSEKEPVVATAEAQVIADLEAEIKGLREALEKKVGKDNAALIEEANRANIRAAKAEGRLVQLEKRLAADPFAPTAADAAVSASPDPFAPTAAPKAKTWQTVQILQGTSNKRGPKFTVWGEWRAHWQFTSGEGGLFIAQIEGDDLADAQMLASSTKSGRDTTMGKGSGELTLDVTALQGSWAVKIEELR
jgi:hypothetical protein